MTAAVERQRWLGALALGVAVPLPLTGIVSWPFLLPFIAVAAWVAWCRRPLQPAPAWLENVLAPAILVAVVAAGGVRYGVLRPVAQLAVLVAAVRLPGCGQRARAASMGGVLAVVGVAGIASSTHPTLALYLVALLVLIVVAAGRLIGVALAEAAVPGEMAVAWPPLRLVVGTAFTAIVVAAPLFALLPRLRSPVAAGPFPVRSLTGFRDAVMLHGIGEVKQSHRLVMRVSFPGTVTGRVSPEWLRLVGVTVTHYRAGSWVEGRLRGERLIGRPGAAVRLGTATPGSPVRRAEIVLERVSGTLFVPVGATAVEMQTAIVLTRERSGALRLPRGTEGPVPYLVEFDPARVEQPAPTDADLEVPPDSDDLHELAEQMTARTSNSLAAALAIEQGLQQRCRYLLQANAPLREDPVRWFLFRSRAGHCEFFASSMVLLLRTLGIPARLQAGFAGAETDGEGGFLVRDSDAHAWVVAFTQGRWRVFDPTPPEGRPGMSSLARADLLRWGWQSLESSWDRWVLTFSMADQIELARRTLDSAVGALRFTPHVAIALGGLLGLAVLLRARRRADAIHGHGKDGGSSPIARVLAALIRDGPRWGVPTSGATTPRGFRDAACSLFPNARESLTWLVAEHERVRYAAGRPPTRREVRRARRETERAMSAK